jgi:hypothetical protein
MNRTLRIIAWNANVLVQDKQELEDLFYSDKIDIVLISEIHFTTWTSLKIRNYRTYTTIHPSGRARSGTAVITKKSIKQYEFKSYSENYIQATSVSINNHHCRNILPPQGGTDEIKLTEFFHTFNSRLIVGSDYNAKHTHWGSRLITPKRRALLKVANNINAEIISTRNQKYWPTDQNKVPDLLDFFIMKGISVNYTEVLELIDLTSNHIPVLLTLRSNIIHKNRTTLLTNKKTNWDLFRVNFYETISLSVKLKKPCEIDSAVEQLTNNIVKAATEATHELRTESKWEITYPMKIRELVKRKCKAWKIWYRMKNLSNKTSWNRISKLLHNKIKEVKNKTFKIYLSELSAENNSDYSLWKTTRCMKMLRAYVPPICKENR